jgi:hypothetical protein
VGNDQRAEQHKLSEGRGFWDKIGDIAKIAAIVSCMVAILGLILSQIRDVKIMLPLTVELKVAVPTQSIPPVVIYLAPGEQLPTREPTSEEHKCPLALSEVVDITPNKPVYGLLKEASMATFRVVNVPDDCLSLIVCLEGPPSAEFESIVCQKDELLGRVGSSYCMMIPRPNDLVYYTGVRSIRGSGNFVLSVEAVTGTVISPPTPVTTIPTWTIVPTKTYTPITPPLDDRNQLLRLSQRRRQLLRLSQRRRQLLRLSQRRRQLQHP